MSTTWVSSRGTRARGFVRRRPAWRPPSRSDAKNGNRRTGYLGILIPIVKLKADSFHARPHQVLNSAQSLEHPSPREPDAGRETETRTRRPARPRGAGEAGTPFQEERRRKRGAEGSAGAKETRGREGGLPLHRPDGEHGPRRNALGRVRPHGDPRRRDPRVRGRRRPGRRAPRGTPRQPIGGADGQDRGDPEQARRALPAVDGEPAEGLGIGARPAPGWLRGRSPAAGRHQSDEDDPVVQGRAPRDRPEGPRATNAVERPHGPDGRGDEESRPRGREGQEGGEEAGGEEGVSRWAIQSSPVRSSSGRPIRGRPNASRRRTNS